MINILISVFDTFLLLSYIEEEFHLPLISRYQYSDHGKKRNYAGYIEYISDTILFASTVGHM